jgi:hypothetical protein
MLRSLTSYVRLLPGYRMYRACKVGISFDSLSQAFKQLAPSLPDASQNTIA